MKPSLRLSNMSFVFLRPNPLSLSSPRATLSLLLPHPLSSKPHFFSLLKPPSKPFSTTLTNYPLQYDLILSRPPKQLPRSKSQPDPEPISDPGPDPEPEFDEWVDRKLTAKNGDSENLDKEKRKYYNKRRRRMYGSDSEDENRAKNSEGFIELTPEVVEFRTLHKREEELYFYDAFAYPWEKEKHYKMVYQLEKKYFPDQCFDKAFLEAGKMEKRREKVEDVRDEKGLIFFEGKEDDEREKGLEKNVKKDAKIDFSEKKVVEFFKGLKKVSNEKGEIDFAEPFISNRNSGLPPKWDGPNGTMVLINKPKGWTSFTVCGKLRRLVNVKKVGHAGTLDPMATGLLIVCVGKATKIVDSYQGMIKGYSGVFRLGEATSTFDADSAINQREPWEHIKDEDIKKAAASFCGEIWQVPPMFSAIKVGGEKMYEKARRGESMELSPRRISIFRFDIERSLDDRQNLIFRVTCSKGTYIRSLCADLGKALGSCAHLTALRRDSIGQYSADDAWDFKELEESITKGYL